MSYQTLKRRVSRAVATRSIINNFAAYEEQVNALGNELQRRMRRMSPEVRELLEPLEPWQLLEFLRAEGIDGTCPRWLASAAKSI